jgi:outer membrane lipoprotein carrier protein
MNPATAQSKAAACLFLIGIILCGTAMRGWAESWEDIQRESAKIQSVNAHFLQEKHMQILAQPLVSKGLFYFQAPDSVRWEYISPVKSVLLSHKGNIKRYTMASKGFVEESGVSLESMQVVLQEIGRWSKGQFTGNGHFTAALQGGKEPRITLTPKEKGISALISQIVINLSAERAGILKSLKIIESAGNYTLFSFTDVQINEAIREALFREVK